MRKSNLKQFSTIKNGMMIGTNTIISSVTNITILDNVGYQFDWTGSPVGIFQIQISANYNQDNEGNVITPGTWVNVTLSYFDGVNFVTSTDVPTSVGTPIYLDLTQLSAPWIRCKYSNTSGTGVLNATVAGKMI
jgi:hypothetical protein